MFVINHFEVNLSVTNYDIKVFSCRQFDCIYERVDLKKLEL